MSSIAATFKHEQINHLPVLFRSANEILVEQQSLILGDLVTGDTNRELTSFVQVASADTLPNWPSPLPRIPSEPSEQLVVASVPSTPPPYPDITVFGLAMPSFNPSADRPSLKRARSNDNLGIVKRQRFIKSIKDSDKVTQNSIFAKPKTWPINALACSSRIGFLAEAHRYDARAYVDARLKVKERQNVDAEKGPIPKTEGPLAKRQRKDRPHKSIKEILKDAKGRELARQEKTTKQRQHDRKKLPKTRDSIPATETDKREKTERRRGHSRKSKGPKTLTDSQLISELERRRNGKLACKTTLYSGLMRTSRAPAAGPMTPEWCACAPDRPCKCGARVDQAFRMARLWQKNSWVLDADTESTIDKLIAEARSNFEIKALDEHKRAQVPKKRHGAEKLAWKPPGFRSIGSGYKDRKTEQ